MLMFFYQGQNSVEIGPVVTEKIVKFSYVNDIWPRSRNDLNLQYSHIFIKQISHRLQSFLKNPIPSLFPSEKPKIQILTLP